MDFEFALQRVPEVSQGSGVLGMRMEAGSVRRILSSPLSFQGAPHLALGVALLQRFAFVVEFLSAGKPELDFDEAMLFIQRKWDDCQSFGCFLADQALHLVAAQEETACVVRVVSGTGIFRLIGRQVHADDRQAAVFLRDEGFLERAVSAAERFDFAPGQHDSSLERVEDFVGMVRVAVRDQGRHGASIPLNCKAVASGYTEYLWQNSLVLDRTEPLASESRTRERVRP